jgi:pyruvate kinase
MPTFNPRTQIICTLGPACRRKDTIVKMARAGMNVARLNFSHGTYKQHQEFIDLARRVNKEHGFHIKILVDLEGYRIRIGQMKKPLAVIKHQHVWMVKGEPKQGNEIPLESDMDIFAIEEGMRVFVSDGMIELKVVEKVNNKLNLEVEHGGIISSRKGVNIPDLKIRGHVLTTKDKKDIPFAVQQKVDYIAQSFVRNQEDIEQVVRLVKPRLPRCRVIAKIENAQGVQNLKRIIPACDGIMVARGDLGVSLPIYKIPIIQKQIIRECIRNKKFVIIATQMLESMIEYPRPTRAEVSDVANAIIDGSDFVMLSGETAAGNYPVKSVRMMRQIIEYTEKNL